MAGPPKCKKQSQQGWCPALGESPWLHLLHHLESSGTPRSRGQAGSPSSDHRTAELLGSHVESCSTWITPCPKNSNLLTFEACVAKTFSQCSCRVQAVGTPGRKGRKGQPGGRLEHPLLCHPPAPSPSSSLLTASCSVTAVVPKADPGVLYRDKIHPKGSFLEISLRRKEEISEQICLRALPLAQECRGERKKKWSRHFPSAQTQFSKCKFETSDNNLQIVTSESRKKSHNQCFSLISSRAVSL